jgi:parvulin-like peptidyl-prolyl isomerase
VLPVRNERKELEENKDYKKLLKWDEEETPQAADVFEEKKKTSKKVLKRQERERERQRKKGILDENRKSRMTTKGKAFIITGAVAVIIGLGMWILFGYFGIGLDWTTALAKVDGTRITEKEVSLYIDFLKNQGSSTVPAEDDPRYDAFKTNMIDSLIVLKIIQKYGAENDFSVTEKEINDEFSVLKENYPSEEEFEKALKDTKVSVNFLKQQIKDRILSDKINVKVTAGASVSDEEVSTYYNENKETMFTVPEQVKVSHILLKFNVPEGQELTDEIKKEALDRITEVENKLKNGEDFERLATAYSEDSSASNGGDVGFISRGQTIPEFEETAFLLDVGEVSQIIETTYGYHILKVTDRQDSYIKTFEEVKESINTYLLTAKQTQIWQDFVYGLIKKSEIVYTTDLKGQLLDIDAQETAPDTTATTETGSETGAETGAETTADTTDAD